jgi:hypothetical protein
MAKDSRRRLPVEVSDEARRVLTAVAYKRAQKNGGKISAAKVIADLIDENLDKLRKEAGPLLK